MIDSAISYPLNHTHSTDAQTSELPSLSRRHSYENHNKVKIGLDGRYPLLVLLPVKVEQEEQLKKAGLFDIGDATYQ
jgi:hypothetical protein